MGKVAIAATIKCSELPPDTPIPVEIQCDPRSKIVLMLRHGQGYHNVAALETPHPWPCGCVNGDPGICPYSRPALTDAELTPLGREQATSAGASLVSAIPEVVYVSPLTRTLETAKLAVEGAGNALSSVPFVANELIRERLGRHFCNKRSPLSSIARRFPKVDFSAVRSEEDVLFREDVWEQDAVMAARGKEFFFDLAQCKEKCVLCVGHASLFAATLNIGFELDNSQGKYKTE